MNLTKRKLASSLGLLAFLSATQLASAFYDPSLGRWLNRDPIGERGGHNLYSFVRNSPVIFFDHYGLQSRGRVRDRVTYLPPRRPDWEPGGPHVPNDEFTIVCDGKGGIRIADAKDYDRSKTDPCVNECGDKHELCHKNDVLKSNPNICVGQPDGTEIRGEPSVRARSEVKCAQEEIDCLNERLGDCSCSDESMNRQLKKMEAYRDRFKKKLGVQ